MGGIIVLLGIIGSFISLFVGLFVILFGIWNIFVGIQVRNGSPIFGIYKDETKSTNEEKDPWNKA